MMTTHNKSIIASALLAGMLLTGATLGSTCPSDLKQGPKGHWTAEAQPGWKSHRTTPKGVTVSGDGFGGVVYSPTRKRLACVYKASDGKWVALVSKVHAGVVIDKNVKDKSGDKPAWKYSKKHGDYACGKPSISKIDECQFELNGSSNKS